MGKFRWGILVLIVSILCACSDNTVQPTIDTELKTAEQAKQYFTEARVANNLIKDRAACREATVLLYSS